MLVNIEKVTVSERFRKDFGNIDELAQDIETNGLINPPVVTHEYELLAGERRLRACKHLGMQQIEVRVMAAKDESHKKHMEYSENENRKDFTFSERLAAAKELERLEREKAKERQGNRTDKQGDIPQNFAESSTTAAKQSGFGNRETYRQAKYIDKHADEETIAQLDDGQLSVNRAYTELKAKLAEKEKEAESERQQRQRPPVIKISTMSSTVMAPASDGFPSQTVVSASTSM